jgi:cholesterol transport system auxiliary component
MMKHPRTWMTALALVPLLAGCGSLLESEAAPEVVYQLRTTESPPLSPTIGSELAVLRPLSRPGLDTDRIVVTLPDRQLDAYRGSLWSARAPDMVQSLLLDDLRARGGWRTVLPDRGEFRGRWVLQTEIRDFQAEYATTGAAPVVRVTLRGELGRAPSRQPVASAVGAGEARATTDRMRDVAAAFEAAYAQAARQLVDALHSGALAAEAAAASTTVQAGESNAAPR